MLLFIIKCRKALFYKGLREFDMHNSQYQLTIKKFKYSIFIRFFQILRCKIHHHDLVCIYMLFQHTCW
nr:MAG TPA: hypothetical protein [Caudoviricetes sp.]